MTKTTWTPELIKRVGLLRAANVQLKEIAASLGVTPDAVESTIHRYHRNVPRRHLFHNLPPDIVEWLIRITPAGASLADTVRSILVDAYNDETS